MHLQALQRGLRQYVSQLNTQTVPSAGKAFFDLTPEADKCQDFHSECAKWAAKVSSDWSQSSRVSDSLEMKLPSQQ